MALISKRFPRSIKWIGFFFLGFVVIIGSGRLIQKTLDSLYQGERAPYLQMPAADAISLRWQSSQGYQGQVNYGTASDLLNKSVGEKNNDEHHELRLTRLKPLTRYYYSVGSEEKAEYKGDDYWFVTPPTTGESIPVRFWITGDQGQAGLVQQQVRDAMLQWLEENPRPNRAYLDFWLTTGDNAYRSGTNEQFQKAFFAPYKNILKNIPVWPAYGNHDARRWTFFDIFSLPEQAESGGIASGTEHYYSFDYANIHFVFLDSESSDLDHDGRMAKWLVKDLQANKQRWLISVIHHPPYTKGTHDSDNSWDSGGRMRDIRKNILPVLEKYGVDLVLSGHSHMYERSDLINCHYGKSDTLTKSMIRQEPKNNVYQKYSKSLASYQGTVYVVTGSSAKLDQGELNHPAMPYSLHELGSMIIDIKNERLISRFINEKGEIIDQFEIIKGVKKGVQTQSCTP